MASPLRRTRASTDPIRFPVLIGDIGGTNARFGLLPEQDSPVEMFEPVATADFPDLEAAVEAAVFAHTSIRPQSALIDVAGPITGDAVALTNAHWVLKPREIMAKTGVRDVILLNDFEALALALTALEGGEMELLGGDPAAAVGAKVVLGPGTGLGVGALIQTGGIFVPVPGEGGHVALGPDQADEFPIWANIEPEDGRISAEALLSGRGLVRLYRAVAQTEGVDAPLVLPAEITGAALAGSDPTATRTVSLYCRLLGRLAGDMALIFMARGGAYIGGGISPRILPFLQEGEFRRAFEAKAPHTEVMSAIPSWVITRDNAALPGLAAFARNPERFGVTLTGRRWR
jgi:glucokinase